MSSGFVDLDGARLAWIRSGPADGPSLVLAHGLTDAAGCWDRVADVLDDSFDVVRFDARGHGASSRAADYSVASHVADLIGLVRALRLDRPVLIGHSMGGVHAAIAAPELDAQAVIAEDPHWREVPEDGSKDVDASRRATAELLTLDGSELLARARTEHPTWAEVDLAGWVRAQPQLDPDVDYWFDSWPTTNRWREHVARLRCPGLLVTGDRNPTVTVAAAAQAQKLWPALEVVRIAGAGHNVRRDRFEPYRRAVTQFLERELGGARSFGPG